jgi:hypothetical protein
MLANKSVQIYIGFTCSYHLRVACLYLCVRIKQISLISTGEITPELIVFIKFHVSVQACLKCQICCISEFLFFCITL